MNEKSFFPSSYNPYDGPNEHPEAELPLVAGKYLYVYGNMDDDGFYEGELYTTNRAFEAVCEVIRASGSINQILAQI